MGGADGSRAGHRMDCRDDEALAQACKRALNVSGDVDVVDSADAEAAISRVSDGIRDPTSLSKVEPSLPRRGDSLSISGPPPKPPGEHWFRYADQDGGFFWWHYDG